MCFFAWGMIYERQVGDENEEEREEVPFLMSKSQGTAEGT